jgi:8-hydroxy-5-deazaflavin:NADPH oxidoreductase
MAIGIIGSGKVGRAIAKQLSRGGHEVVISNSHGPESLASIVGNLGPKVKSGTVADSARQEIVVLAVPWIHLEKALAGLPNWGGRIVIDATNQFLTGPPEFKIADLGDKTSSEVVAGFVPGARVVKAFNTIPAELMEADPREGKGRRVLFLSGDDVAAKKEFGAILEQRGFALIDLGGLREGGRIQQVGGPLPGLNLLKL